MRRAAVPLRTRGVPALAIDITPGAVLLARSSGALALQRDVFGHLPATGRWATVLLADGNIGIGGDPLSLLRRDAPGLLDAIPGATCGNDTARARFLAEFRAIHPHRLISRSENDYISYCTA